MDLEPKIQLLLEPEAVRWRRRTMFLASVMLHIFVIAFILVEPEIFRQGARMLGFQVEPRPRRETTFLTLPPDFQKRLREPTETDRLSDKNRRAQGRSPVIDPNGLRMPYSLGNTKLPEIAGGRPSPPPAPPPTPASGASNPAPHVPPAPPPPKQDESLRLMDVQPESKGGADSPRLPVSTPGEAIQQSLQAAVRGRSSGAAAGPGDSATQFQNVHPNFSTEAPIILSDTRGVDFGPYLARVVYVVRRNWYAVIPESARLGEKGRVAVVFEILKDGSVPQLRLVASSGSDPLDRAALSGVHASAPFPPLPEEFTGNHLVLEFIFLYNVGFGP